MNIARVIHIFYPESIGDPFNSYELSLRQVSMGYKVTVITWAKYGTTLKEKIVNGFEIYRLRGINFKLDGKILEYPVLPNLPNVLEDVNPDIVHAHSHLFMTTFMSVKKAKNMRIPSVVTVHGVLAERDFFTNFAQRLYLNTIGRWIFRNATIIICLTKADASEIMKYGTEKSKIRIIPNPVDTTMFKPSKEKSADPLFIWVGRFVPEKGLQYLVEAMKLTIKECKNIKFILVGDGPIMPFVRSVVKKYGLNSYVKFTGNVDHKLIPGLLSKAYAFVFPSLKEGMPKAVLEAMACGLPVIATNISGMNELIKNGYNGLLVPSKNPMALKKAIVNLLYDRKLAKKLGENARKYIEKNHSWNSVLKALSLIYEDALNNPNRRG